MLGPTMARMDESTRVVVGIMEGGTAPLLPSVLVEHSVMKELENDNPLLVLLRVQLTPGTSGQDDPSSLQVPNWRLSGCAKR